MPRRFGTTAITCLRVLAELLLTLGVLLGALAFYLLVWTNVQTAAAQEELLSEFRERRSDDPTRAVAPEPGDGLNVLHIPRLGKDWEWVVVEGVDTDSLNRGPGHFPASALPGAIGNYAVAGHRATHGEPFADLDQLAEGDKVYVEAADGWFTYRVTWTRITSPSAVELIAPVPGKPGAEPEVAMMTLVTCHPRWGSSERLIVGAQLIERRTLAAGAPKELD